MDPIKTPEQIAEDIQRNIAASLPTLEINADEILWIVGNAIEADRAQRTEESFVARKTWLDADFEGELSRRTEVYESLTEAERAMVVGFATESRYAHALADCTDQDWTLVEAAVDEALEEFARASKRETTATFLRDGDAPNEDGLNKYSGERVIVLGEATRDAGEADKVFEVEAGDGSLFEALGSGLHDWSYGVKKEAE